MDPDQTAPTGSVWSESALFVREASKHFNRRQKQTTFVVIGALKVNSFHSKHFGIVHCVF